MSVIDRALNGMFSKRSASQTVSTGNDFFGFLSSGGKGMGAVGYKKALKLPAFYNGVDQIGNSLGIIPFNVYRRTDEGRERESGHPVDVLLTREPDGRAGYLTPFLFKKITQTSVLLRGNCLWIIKSDGTGRQKLKFVPWEEVYDIRKMEDQGLVYRTKYGEFLASEVLHFKGFTYDGVIGISVIQHACLQLGVALEIQEFSYTNFTHKGVRQGVITTDKAITATDAKSKIIQGFKTAMAEKSPDRVVVLDEGMDFTPITVTPQEAQVIESARFSIEDIARWLNIPLPKIKSVTQSTNNNIEQQTLDYMSDTMQPWVTNFEEEINKKMFTDAEKGTMYAKGNMNVIVRGDLRSRGEFYSKMVNSGLFTPNEIRELEDKNKKEGGDELRFPVNTQTQEQINQNNDGNEN